MWSTFEEKKRKKKKVLKASFFKAKPLESRAYQIVLLFSEIFFLLIVPTC